MRARASVCACPSVYFGPRSMRRSAVPVAAAPVDGASLPRTSRSAENQAGETNDSAADDWTSSQAFLPARSLQSLRGPTTASAAHSQQRDSDS